MTVRYYNDDNDDDECSISLIPPGGYQLLQKYHPSIIGLNIASGCKSPF